MRRCCYLSALIVIATGCETNPTTPTPEPNNQISSAAPLELGDLTKLLERAREQSGNAARSSYISAIQKAMALGQYDLAISILQEAQLDELETTSSAALALAAARSELALRRGNTQEAENQLALALLNPNIDAHLLTKQQIRIAEHKRDYATAAELLMRLEISPEEKEAEDLQQALQNRQDKIWRYLNLSSETRALQGAAGNNPVSAAWWQLRNELRNGFTLGAQRQSLLRWQQRHPNHPALTPLPTALQSREIPQRSAHIALLLPLSGPLASAGERVRDGFISAFLYAQGFDRGYAEVQVSVFDSHNQNPAALLEQALAEGANFFVGPLQKDKVTAVAALNPPIAGIALNYLTEGRSASAPVAPDETGPATDLPTDTQAFESADPASNIALPKVIQFGLAVEDEAHAVAQRMAAEGIERVLLLSGPRSWSRRAANEYLSSADGLAVTYAEVNNAREVTPTIAQLLLAQDSQQRHGAITDIIESKSEFVARSREDLDAVVAFIDAAPARALRPALNFHFVGGLPIFTSSQLTQQLDEKTLSEVNGFRTTEIPWRLTQDNAAAHIQAGLASNTSGENSDAQSALVALGVDAFRLWDQLPEFNSNPYHKMTAATGYLTIDANGRVNRDPIWALIRKGQLQALPTIIEPGR